MHRRTLRLGPFRRGLHDITRSVGDVITASGLQDGLCHVFLQHTSASLILQENADPDVLADLEAWMARAVPDGDPRYRHTAEGPDDMPSHIRAALTMPSVTLPVTRGHLEFGAWQALYLYEHRTEPHMRRLVVTVWGP